MGFIMNFKIIFNVNGLLFNFGSESNFNISLIYFSKVENLVVLF